MDSTTLLSYMPDYYRDSNLTKNILDAISNELNRYLENCEETKNELKIYTASKTLDKYERDFAIPIDYTDSDDYRISNILAKLRGQGIITTDTIKNIVNAYTDSTCDITRESTKYTLNILINKVGKQYRFDDLRATLNKLKAADWIINYGFKETLSNDSNLYIGSALIVKKKYTLYASLNTNYNISSSLKLGNAIINKEKYYIK